MINGQMKAQTYSLIFTVNIKLFTCDGTAFILHHENLSMQYMKIFSPIKIENFIRKKKKDIFLIFAQNIDCGYTLEPLRRGGSNEYPKSMFLSKNKKNMYTQGCIPQFYYIKVGFKGVFIARTCFCDVKNTHKCMCFS